MVDHNSITPVTATKRVDVVIVVVVAVLPEPLTGAGARVGSACSLFIGASTGGR